MQNTIFPNTLAIAVLRKIGNMSPNKMRNIIYDNSPLTLGDIKRLYKDRGELIVTVFEYWLEGKCQYLER